MTILVGRTFWSEKTTDGSTRVYKKYCVKGTLSLKVYLEPERYVEIFVVYVLKFNFIFFLSFFHLQERDKT